MKRILGNRPRGQRPRQKNKIYRNKRARHKNEKRLTIQPELSTGSKQTVGYKYIVVSILSVAVLF